MRFGFALLLVIGALAGCTSALEPEHSVADFRDAPDTLSIGGEVLYLDRTEVIRNLNPLNTANGVTGRTFVKTRSGQPLPDSLDTRLWLLHGNADLFSPVEGQSLVTDRAPAFIVLNFWNGPQWTPLDSVHVVVEVTHEGRVGILGKHGIRIEVIG